MMAGTPENVVRSLIGAPLVGFTNTDCSVTMIYSFPDHRYFVLYYKSRGVCLSNSAVTSTWSFVNNM